MSIARRKRMRATAFLSLVVILFPIKNLQSNAIILKSSVAPSKRLAMRITQKYFFSLRYIQQPRAPRADESMSPKQTNHPSFVKCVVYLFHNLKKTSFYYSGSLYGSFGVSMWLL